MTKAEIKDWILEHRVCFEMSPHFEIHLHQKVQVGFEVALFARPRQGGFVDPGGGEAQALFEGLRQVVAAVMPSGVDYALGPFDFSFHLRTSSLWRPEVQLVAEILHGSTFAAVDDEERGYARAVRKALLELGASEGTWPEARVAAR
jgi:hypothetical protein